MVMKIMKKNMIMMIIMMMIMMIVMMRMMTTTFFLLMKMIIIRIVKIVYTVFCTIMGLNSTFVIINIILISDHSNQHCDSQTSSGLVRSFSC